VLARHGRVNRLQSMPMVRRDDYHGIKVRSGQECAIVIIRRAGVIRAAGAVGGVGFLYTTLAVLTPQTINIADSQHLNVSVTSQPA